MESYLMTWERRRTFRFKPKKRCFASLGSHLSQVGKIIDISLSGLSFEFVSDRDAGEKDSHVDIFTIDEACHLSGLPCSLVYQAAESLPGKKEDSAETFMARRCGIKFNNLQIEQWSKLDDILEKEAPAEDSRVEGKNEKKI
jgi:hypothetical protein